MSPYGLILGYKKYCHTRKAVVARKRSELAIWVPSAIPKQWNVALPELHPVAKAG